jgi:outer membrane protein TolC
VGTQASYPLFSGGARARAWSGRRRSAGGAQAELGLVVREVEDAVDGALAAYRSALSRARALEAAVAQSAEVARIEALALEVGAGVQTDYLRAEAELLAARARWRRHATARWRPGSGWRGPRAAWTRLSWATCWSRWSDEPESRSLWSVVR